MLHTLSRSLRENKGPALVTVLLSALGILNPVTGALWHNCGSVFVVVNAALLLRLKDTDSAN